MLQIITYLLCVYLVFKGVEILQIALASPRTNESRKLALMLGAAMVGISILVAIGFAIWITDQAVGVSIPNR